MTDQSAEPVASDWGCGHVTDEQGNVLNIKCVECYLGWYLEHKDD